MKPAKIGIFFVTLLACCFLGWYFVPPCMDWLHVKKSYHDAGLTCKSLSVGESRFSYSEGGKGEVLLCLHGFGSDKKAWISYGQHLRKNYHVIAIDLPSHGDTFSFPNQHFDLYSLAKKVHVFVEKMGISHFYIMGSSMGGGVALAYSLFYPNEVDGLILMNPLGVPFEKNDFLKNFEKGKNPLLPRTLDELDECFCFLTGKPLSLGYPFKAYVVRKLKEKYSFLEKAFNELIQTQPLTPFLPQIKTKTLLLASGKDRVINPSSYEVFHSKLPNVSYVYFPEGTHVFLGKCQEVAMEKISQFLEEGHLQNEAKR
ncbi:MAG: alpha/beta hydrolase [Chlamydiota bacterium]